jgi:hypothetical protein
LITLIALSKRLPFHFSRQPEELERWGAASKPGIEALARTVNDPAGTNATQARLQGTHLHTRFGKVFMPGFGNGYSDTEIAAVVNFVTGRFGKTASALTAR